MFVFCLSAPCVLRRRTYSRTHLHARDVSPRRATGRDRKEVREEGKGRQLIQTSIFQSRESTNPSTRPSHSRTHTHTHTGLPAPFCEPAGSEHSSSDFKLVARGVLVARVFRGARLAARTGGRFPRYPLSLSHGSSLWSLLGGPHAVGADGVGAAIADARDRVEPRPTLAPSVRRGARTSRCLSCCTQAAPTRRKQSRGVAGVYMLSSPHEPSLHQNIPGLGVRV